MRPRSPNRAQGLDRLVSELASRQHGVVARGQLLDLGIAPGAIKWRIGRGRLHPIHPGVYLVGHRAARRGTREMAACLACGDSAVVSHRSAAALWGLLPYPDSSTAVSITVVGSDRRSRPGIEVHRVEELRHDDVRTFHAIAVTSPARTIVDVAATVGPAEVELSVANAIRERLVREAELRDQLVRNRGRPGVPTVRLLLDRHGGPKLTRSEAERRLLALLRRAGLPEPEVNAKLHGYEVDLLWREQRVVVEVDGYRFHSDPVAFQRDRDRSNDLQLRGYTILRITWRDLTRRPAIVIARLRRALETPIGE